MSEADVRALLEHRWQTGHGPDESLPGRLQLWRRRFPRIAITLPALPRIELEPWPCPWVYDDGGRAAAGYRDGSAGDCAVRAIAIATQLPYRDVHEELDRRTQALARRAGVRRIKVDKGVPRVVGRAYLRDLGWTWTPTVCPQDRRGVTVHLRSSELPDGRLIAVCTKHITAVVDGVVHDTYNPTRGGSRAVYGYWASPVSVAVVTRPDARRVA